MAQDDEPDAPRVLPYGEGAALVELGDLDAVLRLYGDLDAHRPDGVVELVPAARTLLVGYDDAGSFEAVRGTVTERWAALTSTPAQAERDDDVVEVPVRYDGPDLADVARLLGLDEAEVVARHTGGTYRSGFCGFAPGFAYLTGLDEALHVPRRDDPRTKVPTGSVALADEFTAIYPRVSPGGWQLIGSTDLTVWDLDRDPPTLLVPGTPVRFVEAS